MATTIDIFYTTFYHLSIGLFSLFAFFNTFGVFYTIIRSGKEPLLMENPNDRFHASIVLFARNMKSTLADFMRIMSVISIFCTGKDYFATWKREHEDIKELPQPVDIHKLRFYDLYDDIYYKDDKSKLMETHPLSAGIVNKATYLIDFTTQGNVCMYFDVDTKCFAYYSDRNIPNDTLISLARKFIVQMKCPQVCYLMKHRDEEDEKKNGQSEENENAATTIPRRQGLAASRGVIAKLKPTVITTPPVSSATSENGQPDSSVVPTVVTENTINREKDFKFNKRGTMMDFQFLQKQTYKKCLANKSTKINLSLLHPESLSDISSQEDDAGDDIIHTGEKTSEPLAPRDSIKAKNRKRLSQSTNLGQTVTVSVDKSKLTFAEYKRIFGANSNTSAPVSSNEKTGATEFVETFL
jgi:hypothetical protein